MEAYLETSDPLNERQFRIAVKRLATSLSYGTDASPFLGSGVEYVQSRLYEPGDPVRSVDWRVTARTGKFHVKEYEAPKRMPVYLLVDTSASMTIRSGKLSKYAWAVQIAGGLALACTHRMSPVGIVGVGERDLHHKPSLSRDQIYQWLYRLRRFRFDERTTLGARVCELGPSLSSRCLIIVLSDLHDPEAFPALKLVSQQHECVVLQLQDPAGRDLRGAGIFRAQEAETGAGFFTHGRKRWVRPEQVAQELKRCQIDHLLLPLDQPILSKLVYFFRSRDRLGKGAR